MINDKKILNFIIYVNENKKFPVSRSQKEFKGINSFWSFWCNHKERIYEYVKNEENNVRENYPVAYEIIKNRYELGRMNFRYLSFIEYVDKEGTIPSRHQNKSTEEFGNVGVFWDKYKSEIYEYVQNEINEVKKDYPVAYEIIVDRYELGRMKLKYLSFIEYVDKEGTIPSRYQNKSTEGFSNVGVFWDRCKTEIYEYVKNKQNKVKEDYPEAYRIIKDRYELGRMKLKYLSFIKYIDKTKKIPVKGSKVGFEDINDVCRFWQEHKEEIYEHLREFEEDYPEACKIIQYKCELDIMEFKYLSFVKYVDETKNIPLPKENKSTEGINNIGNFWYDYRHKIYNYIINNEKIKNEYLEACNLIVDVYLNGNYKKNLYIDFIEYVNENGQIPSTEKKVVIGEINDVGRFWYNHRNAIYNYVINSKDIKNKYSLAYEIICNKYKKYIIKKMSLIDKWADKKVKDEILSICDRENIIYEKNASLLEHISYKEFVSKINYLKSINTPICYNDGMLHGIFLMSDINMQMTYGISNEEMAVRYFDLKIKKK